MRKTYTKEETEMRKIITVFLLLLCFAGSAYSSVYKRTVTVTYYCIGPCKVCNTCGKTSHGITRGNLASRGEYKAGYRIVATRNKAWPPGTIFIAESGEKFVRADTGGRGVGKYHLDVLCLTHKEAVRGGRKKMVVYVYAPPCKSK